MDCKIIVPDFVLVPYQLIVDVNLEPLDRLLYGFIYWFHSLRDGRCIASNKTFQQLLGIKSVGSIQNSLSRLEKHNYIQRIYKDTKRKVRKQIVPLIAFGRVSLNNDKVSLYNGRVSLYHDQSNNINNNNKRVIAKPKKEAYNFDDKLDLMREDKNRLIQIIALYWEFKRFTFENEKQYQSALRRELKPAKDLAGYENDQITAVMDWLDTNADFTWKLGTLHKFIDEDLEELEPFNKKKNYNN